jgi:hypothetical protein
LHELFRLSARLAAYSYSKKSVFSGPTIEGLQPISINQDHTSLALPLGIRSAGLTSAVSVEKVTRFIFHNDGKNFFYP